MIGEESLFTVLIFSTAARYGQGCAATAMIVIPSALCSSLASDFGHNLHRQVLAAMTGIALVSGAARGHEW